MVFDDIELTEAKEVQWRLHTPSQVEFGTDSIHLLQENLEYKLTLTGEALSSPQLVPEINDADGFYGDVESDAQKQIHHLEWQLPARLTHRVVMSCAKESELCCRLMTREPLFSGMTLFFVLEPRSTFSSRSNTSSPLHFYRSGLLI
ncbi:hypothetical protein JCM19052_1657 [Vibrio sp. JCM 19052]|nr:hypothetical protein JCM19052_1657 [Vibrio sp. JCM 19052]